jgi:hypothetical protein
MLIGGLMNLSEREFFDAGGFLFGGVAGLWLAYRNYRIARRNERIAGLSREGESARDRG